MPPRTAVPPPSSVCTSKPAVPEHILELKGIPLEQAKGRKWVYAERGVSAWKLEMPDDVVSIIIADESVIGARVVPKRYGPWRLFVCPGATLEDVRDMLRNLQPPKKSVLYTF